MNATSEYVVRAGNHLFLGIGSSARAGAIERARRFPSKAEAEAAAEALRIRGALFSIPWQVESVGSKEGGVA